MISYYSNIFSRADLRSVLERVKLKETIEIPVREILVVHSLYTVKVLKLFPINSHAFGTDSLIPFSKNNFKYHYKTYYHEFPPVVNLAGFSS